LTFSWVDGESTLFSRNNLVRRAAVKSRACMHLTNFF
jgi:hypothetical protein